MLADSLGVGLRGLSLAFVVHGAIPAREASFSSWSRVYGTSKYYAVMTQIYSYLVRQVMDPFFQCRFSKSIERHVQSPFDFDVGRVSDLHETLDRWYRQLSVKFSIGAYHSTDMRNIYLQALMRPDKKSFMRQSSSKRHHHSPSTISPLASSSSPSLYPSTSVLKSSHWDSWAPHQ